HGGVAMNAITDEKAATFGAELRMKVIAVDGVVDHGELRFGQMKAVADLVLDHVRIADDGLQPWTRVELPFDSGHVPVVRRQREAQPPERRGALAALPEPHRVHAVMGAIDVAAQEPLVRFDAIRRGAADDTADRASEAPVTPKRTHEPRIADDRLDQLQLGLRPRPR